MKIPAKIQTKAGGTTLLKLAMLTEDDAEQVFYNLMAKQAANADDPAECAAAFHRSWTNTLKGKSLGWRPLRALDAAYSRYINELGE